MNSREPTREPTHRFTPQQIEEAKVIIAREGRLVPDEPETARDTVQHGLSQLVRFTYQAQAKGEMSLVRAVQLGVNIGRTQQVLHQVGGVDAWWRTFKPFVEKQDWAGLEAQARLYLTVFGLEQPTDEFINSQ